VNAYAVVFGVSLLLAAPLLVRYRRPLARWQIESRVDLLRRHSLMNAKYVEREVDALTRPGSEQLSRFLVVVFALFLGVVGVYAILRGLAVV
jgi:hypothetical protein